MNHLRTIRALFKKDIKDTGKNANVLILLLLPVFFCVLYNLLDFGGEVLPSRTLAETVSNICASCSMGREASIFSSSSGLDSFNPMR